MKKRILVVDDNRMTLNFLTRTLESEGHTIFSAEDGLSALDILTSLTPDIIFIDLIMPKIGGDKLIRIIRKMPHLNRCFLVIVSGAIGDMEVDFTEIGADMYIAKGPFDKMAAHVLTAVNESDTPREADRPKQAMGLEASAEVPVHARQVTKELLSRSRYLETILESMAEGILVVFADRVVYANSAAVSLFGIPEEKLLAAYPPDLFDNISGPQADSLLWPGDDHVLEIGQDIPVELNNRQVNIKSMPIKGELQTRVMLISDVTERRQLQLQLQHFNKMEAIGTIANGVAHNFRNILAGVLANIQVIQMELEDGSVFFENAKRIDVSVKKGVQLINGLMQFSRRQVKNEHERIDLCDVIQETYRLISETFEKKIEILVDLPESLPVMGNRSDLGLVLMNLCTNAHDAMPQGGRLQIAAAAEDGKATVTVSDSGKGMSKKVVERCFDPFFTTKEVGKGTGLGLSTSYGIVKSHRGEIGVESRPNKGSVFKMSLPLIASEDENGISGEVRMGNNEKILVVDDEIEMLKAMPGLLESLNYQAAIASNWRDAVETYKKWNPDGVLMDINMPELDGISCIMKIAEHDPGVKAVIISGYQEDVLNGLDAEQKKFIKGFLEKPFGKRELGISLAKLFS